MATMPADHLQIQSTTRRPPALPTQNKPVKAPRIGRKLAKAIDLIVFEGKDLQEAAQGAELTTFQLRQAFARAHVIAHLKARREVLRAAASGQNILRLMQIRDAADNMPAVNAIKALEDLGTDERIARTGNVSTPGIVIRIVTASNERPAIEPITIDATAEPDAVSDDDTQL